MISLESLSLILSPFKQTVLSKILFERYYTTFNIIFIYNNMGEN